MRFFHIYASTRQINHSIKGLHDQHGVWREEDEQVQEIVVQYFENLFTTTTTTAEMLTPREVVNRVT